MAENSKIEWTDATFNCWRGCTRISEGCRHCYAETLSGRNPKTLGVWGPQGTRVVAAGSAWKEPVKWNRLAAEGRLPDGSPNVDGRRPRVFCASLADVFEEWQGPMSDSQGRTLYRAGVVDWHTEGPPSVRLTMDDVRRRLFALIDATPNLDWLLVTKRPENAARMWPAVGFPDAGVPGTLGRRLRLPNVWLIASVENQDATARIPELLKVPAVVRGLSMEPLLGPVEFSNVSRRSDAVQQLGRKALDGISWVIVGGESGPGSRPLDVAWVRSIVGQCKAASVPVFVKQLGAKPLWQEQDSIVDEGENGNPLPRSLWRAPLLDRKGGDIAEWPDDLKVREFPAAGTPAAPATVGKE